MSHTRTQYSRIHKQNADILSCALRFFFLCYVLFWAGTRFFDNLNQSAVAREL